MSKPVIESKLHLPRPGRRALRRQRLLKSLAEGRHRKVILICAPAGYGKTTLVAQFLNRTRSAYVYYLLEPTDSDPAVFLSYLLAGLRSVKPGFGRKTERLVHLFNYPQRFFETIAGTLANEINDGFKNGLYIVLDDYQALENAPLIDRLVDHLLRHLGPPVRFIIVSRFVPEIPLGLRKGRGEVLELAAEQLRFDRREILDYFAASVRERIREAEAARIESYSEGWPVALRFLQEAFQQGEDLAAGREKWGSRSLTDLFQYFAQEIYDREPPAVQDFLKRCAIPEWLTPELCNRITGRNDSAEVLAALVRRNIFLFPYGRSGYRFHNLFRDFLNRKISDAQEERQISRRTADFYRVREQAEEALKFYFRAGDYETAAGIVEDIGPELIGQGKSRLLQDFLQMLPDKIIRSRYRLLLHQSQVLLFTGRSEEAKQACIAAIRFLKAKAGRSAEYADALYKLAGLYLNEGNYKTAARLFLNALKAGSRKAPQVYASILNSYASLVNAIGGRPRSGVARYFRTARQLARKVKNPELEASVLNNWARSEWEEGKIETAYPKFIRMAELLKDHFTPGCGGGFFNAARLSLMTGDRAEARKILDLGSKTCRDYDDLFSRARINHGYALLFREMTDLRRAGDYIGQALEDYRRIGVPGLIAGASVDAAKIALDLGRFAQAEKDLAAARGLKQSIPDADTVPLLVLDAEIKLRQGGYEEAAKVLRDAKTKAGRYKKVVDLLEISFRLAEARFLNGETEAAVDDLLGAIRLARARGMSGLFFRGLQKEAWLADLVKSQAGRPDWPDMFEPLRLPVLRARFFGSAGLTWNGKAVDDRSWPTSKAKKTFFYLIYRHPDAVSADHLIETLWPGSGRIEGQNSLRKAIQHIRQALSGAGAGQDVIQTDRGSYSIGPGVIVLRDLDPLQKLPAKADLSGKGGPARRKELERILEQAEPGVANGWFDEWVEKIRAELAKRRETGFKLVAEQYWSRKKFREASRFYKKLAAMNPYEESYHRGLMRIAARQSNYHEVKRIYERLASRLREEMGVSPQAETTGLYKSLTAGKN